MKQLITLCALLFGLVNLSVAANALSPVGLWKTIDDKTGQAKSVVEIWIENGALNGKIVELIDPSEKCQKCSQCEGNLKDHPILGMRFIWGLTEKGGVWDDGEIVDPESGKVYSARIKVTGEGKTLDVRGYIGFAFAGRSQVWHRVDRVPVEP